MVVGAAVALVGAGRLFGVVELFVVGMAAAALAGACLGAVNVARMRLAVSRHVTPERVYAGTPSRVELTIRNDGERPTRVLRLQEPVTGTRGADVLVGPLDPGESSRAAYRLPTERRGIVEVGPLEIVVTDPFGLAASTTVAAPVVELTVFPRVDDILPVRHTTGYDPHAGAEHPSALGRAGEDFYALRRYVVGDDLRRVHWPSTARRDELMVRQDELPWQGRVTVLLDVRRSAHDAESLELAVSATASILTASWKRRDLVRLVTTDAVDFGFAAGAAHGEAIMEHLALVGAGASGSLTGAIDALAVGPNGGALVVVTARAGDPPDTAVHRLRRQFGSLTMVCFDRSWRRAEAPVRGPGGRGEDLVLVHRDITFRDAWNDAMHGRLSGPFAAATVGPDASQPVVEGS